MERTPRNLKPRSPTSESAGTDLQAFGFSCVLCSSFRPPLFVDLPEGYQILYAPQPICNASGPWLGTCEVYAPNRSLRRALGFGRESVIGAGECARNAQQPPPRRSGGLTGNICRHVGNCHHNCHWSQAERTKTCKMRRVQPWSVGFDIPGWITAPRLPGPKLKLCNRPQQVSAFPQQCPKVQPFSPRGLGITPVLCNGSPDALDPIRRLCPRAEPAV